jgi:predicted nucleotidyltransferase
MELLAIAGLFAEGRESPGCAFDLHQACLPASVAAIYMEMCAMMIGEKLAANRDEVLSLAAKHGARNVRVFGSAARGELTPDSDIDLLVDMGTDHSPWFPAGLIVDLEDLLGCSVDVVTEGALHWFVRDRVLAEARPL